MQISCVGDFLRIVKFLTPLDNDEIYYRGQSNNSYDVTSSIYREINNNYNGDEKDRFANLYARSLFNDFTHSYPLYPEVHKIQNYQANDLDLLIAAQHYGLNTRLIDFSTSPLIALYFATEKVQLGEKCSIFMIFDTPNHRVITTNSIEISNEIRIEKKFFLDATKEAGQRAVSNTDIKSFSQYLERLYSNKEISNFFSKSPIYINESILSYHLQLLPNKGYSFTEIYQLLSQGSLNYLADISSIRIFNTSKYIVKSLPINPRIRNQQGVLMFSNYINQMEYESSDFNTSNLIENTDNLMNIDLNKGFYRIDITYEAAVEIQKELSLYGVSKDFIYPELNSFTSNLNNKALKTTLKSYFK